MVNKFLYKKWSGRSQNHLVGSSKGLVGSPNGMVESPKDLKGRFGGGCVDSSIWNFSWTLLCYSCYSFPTHATNFNFLCFLFLSDITQGFRDVWGGAFSRRLSEAEHKVKWKATLPTSETKIGYEVSILNFTDSFARLHLQALMSQVTLCHQKVSSLNKQE